jgi:hypothetical protein
MKNPDLNKREFRAIMAIVSAGKAGIKKPVVGEAYKAWFTGDRPDGYSTILKVEKYTGNYPEFFKWVVTLAAPNTRSGKIEMAL